MSKIVLGKLSSASIENYLAFTVYDLVEHQLVLVSLTGFLSAMVDGAVKMRRMATSKTQWKGGCKSHRELASDSQYFARVQRSYSQQCHDLHAIQCGH